MRNPIRLFLLLACCCWVTAANAQAQSTSSNEIDDSTKADVLAAFSQRLSETYAFPDRAEAISAHLRDNARAGEYDNLTERQFADALTSDIRAFTSDLHFSVRYDPQRFEEIEALGIGPNPARARFAEGTTENSETPSEGMAGLGDLRRGFERSNFSMPHAEVFEGNIGYLRFGIFPPIDLARATVDAAMAFLANTDAIILDLRAVPGGVGGFTPYLASYFFADENRLLFSRDYAWADRTEETRTLDVGGARRPDVPVWILTSEMTGSAGENLSYTLQQHGRATVVGKRTRGAANSSSIMQLSDGFIAQVPIARVVHPITETNWEGTGVIPDVMVTASGALVAARIEALELLAESTKDNSYRRQLVEAREALEKELASESDNRSAAEAELAEYAGTYGVRRIFVDDGTLKYQREGGPAIRIVRKNDDLFRFDLDPNMRSAVALPDLQFERNETGAVYQLSLVRADGSIEEVLEKDS